MNTIFLNIIFMAVRRVVTAELFQEILTLVQLQTDLTIPGVEKKAAVTAQLKAIKTNLATTIRALPSWLLSMAIDIAVAEVNKKLGK